MKYKPTENEIKELFSSTEEQRLYYCLTRIVESEEVWGLAERQGWVMSEKEDSMSLPIWPYREFAIDCKINERKDAEPQAISLEHFIYKVSQQLIENLISVEVFPTKEAPGRIVDAKTFFKALESMMESGDYFMEG